MEIGLADIFKVQLFSCTHALSTNHALSLMSSYVESVYIRVLNS